VPDSDADANEFQKPAADFMSAQIAFTNAVIAARTAGISDQELAAISEVPESETSRIPN
jgi:hypothetical protein